MRQIQLALQHGGTSPGALLRDTRLDLARKLLADDPGRSVTEVAFASGFRSLSAFGAAYRRRFGLTPQESRHQ